METSSVWEGLKQILALVFVNLIALLLDPSFLTVAISIDALVLGISVQALTSRRTEERLDTALQEMISLAKLAAETIRHSAAVATPQQRKVVV